MARGVNKVILVGNLGQDPDMKYSQGGMAICTLSLATTSAWKDKGGEMQERTEWHRVTLFGKLGEIAGEYLKKGRQVYIEGSIRYEKWTDDAGVERYATKIIADEMQMLGGGQRDDGSGGGEPRERRAQRPDDRPASGNRPAGGGPREYGAGPPARQDDPFPDDDIPF